MPLQRTGSLTVSALVLAIAWALREAQERRRRAKQQQPGGAHGGHPAAPAAVARLTADAIGLLAATRAVPHLLLDVRPPEAAAAAPLSAWLGPAAAAVSINQLHQALADSGSWTSLAQPVAGQSPDTQHPLPPLPGRHTLLLLVAADEAAERLAVSRASAAGFDRLAVPGDGALQQLLQQAQQPAPASSAPAATLASPSSSTEQKAPGGWAEAAAAGAALRFPALHADALAVLLGLAPLPEAAWALLVSQHAAAAAATAASPPPWPQQQAQARTPGHSRSPSGSSLHAAAQGGEELAAGQQQQQQREPRLVLLDVRRSDERVLYGTLPGASHLPLDALAELSGTAAAAAAAGGGDGTSSSNANTISTSSASSSRAWQRLELDPSLDVVVVHSRAGARALWAAQLLHDAGCQRVLVYREGVCGWCFGGVTVEAYPPYQRGELPPEPEPSPLREPDAAAGVLELQALGLLPLLVQQHARASCGAAPPVV